MKISSSFGDGIRKVQRDLEAAGAAFHGIDARINFDVHSSADIERSMAQADQLVDEIIAIHPRNEFVAKLGAQVKAGLRTTILEHAAKRRIGKGSDCMTDQHNVLGILSQISEVILDLQSVDYQTMRRHAQALARLVRAPELAAIVDPLVIDIDLDAWLEAGRATQSSMIGSAILDWPNTTEAELGTTILLIDRFASDDDFAFGFAHTFYHSGGNYNANLRKMVGGALVPFERTFSRYVKTKLNLSNPATINGNQTLNQFTFNNSTVGAVQTGNASVANVTMGANNAELSRALEQLAAGIAQLSALPHHDKDEILELIADSRAELGKEKPSKAKLAALIPMIGNAATLVTEVGGAWESVKAAATVLGIGA